MSPRRPRGRASLLVGTATLSVAAVAAGLVSVSPGPSGVRPAAARVATGPATGSGAAAAAGHAAGAHRHRPARPEVQHAPVVHDAPSRQAADAAGTTRQRSAIDAGLQSRLVRKMSHSTAGVYGLVVDVEGVGTVASVRPHRALRPASTQKLFTTLPLLLDDPDRTLVTTVTSGAGPRHGVVHGNLVVHAAADPSLTVRDVNRLAKRVRAAGVRRVTGSLRLDIGTLPLTTRRSGWKWSFVPSDVGPLSPFPVGRDWWRTDASYLRHPTGHNLALFRERLAAHGVRVHGGSHVVRDAADGVVLARHRSRPIRGLVHTTLTNSDNFFAETLLTLAGGHPAVGRVLDAAGITDPSSATDGSGLSYDDRETAAGEVALLHYAAASPARDALRNALPVGCRTGTLEDRFCGTEGAGRVFAKTGTLSHSRALTGYTTDGRGRLVTFAVICSQVRNLTAAARATDRAVLAMRGYTGP